ncbi:MAG: S9 family peptidase [Acidobacteria bacterium]|nr:S9 family peptidase [Acidobacteriota bacterium]
MLKRYLASALVVVIFAAPAFAQYMKPPQAILDVLNAPVTPQTSVSPTRDYMMMAQQLRYPPISEVAAPMLRLAGLRINPATNGPHRAQYSVALTLKKIADGSETRVALPPNAKVSMPRWSFDGKQFAFTNTVANGIELWVGETATGRVRKITGATINAAHGQPLDWADNSRLLVQLVKANRGRAPVPSPVPDGPNIQETAGRAGPIRTYQDMLRSKNDENLFEFYATSQLAFVDVASGRITPIGPAAIYASADISPDGKHLLVTTVRRPFSYLHPSSSFPRTVEVWDATGKAVHKVADFPLADTVPIGGVRTGPRNYQWQPAAPSTLVWVEALDEGNPKTRVPFRDRIVALSAPFSGPPVEIHKTEHRFAGLSWLEKDKAIFVSDNDRDRRWERTFLVSLDKSFEPKKIWDMSAEDRYNDPGSAVTRLTPTGHSVALQNGDFIYLQGQGASPDGDLPFLDRFNLRTLRSERIYRAKPGTYESVVALLADDASRFITRYETAAEPPNYLIKNATGQMQLALTKFTDPTPVVRKVTKQLVKYKRTDGVDLSFTLYLPPDYKQGTRLPTIVWAYPREYTDTSTAGQVSGSAARFTTIAGASQLFYVLQGYAVLDDAAIPIIGTPEHVNDTYVQQLTAGAKAAIDKAVEMGVTDPNRVGVGGHSYGGFMTANLLAHTDLFKAGVARSGAYNRTLTPFGFQNEQRTFWEAEETYLKMSPFMYADQLKEPILFIHGEADDNTGTFPIQSERMYQAIRGHGGIARLVMLPNEAHGYAARESIEHTLYEMLTWMERWVKDVQAGSH